MTQYQKDFVRMLDSMRDTSKGAISCIGVDADKCEKCLLADMCDNEILYNAEKIIEIVNSWAKEHPLVTMADKYKEVFGVEPVHTESEIKVYLCPKLAGLGADIKCTVQTCGKCNQDFWGAEYKPPKREESES